MTKEKFNIEDRAIIVPVYIETDGVITLLYFILDTGTQETLICETAMRRMGYVRANSIAEVPIQTVGGRALAYRYVIDNLKALGVKRSEFDVISHTMPDDAGIDGLLGLDFFENTELTIDFKRAEIRVVSE
jgi:predicted aspartyl protease